MFTKGHPEYRKDVHAKKHRKRTYKNGAKKDLIPALKYQEGYLDRLDFRMDSYTNLAKSYAQIMFDLGGIESLSRIEQSLCERFVFVEFHIRKIENEMLKSKNGNTKELFEKWTHFNNALQAIATKLGTVIRKPKSSKLKKHLAETYVD